MNAFWKRFLPRRRPKSLALLYHRVAAPATDPQLLAVSPENFSAQLRVLAEIAAPVSLAAAIATTHPHAEGRIPIAVTFDDGYADNALAAFPALRKESVPASLFVTSGAIGRRDEFWWDEVERIFLHPGCLPPSFALEIEGARLSIALSDAAEYTPESFARHKDWHVLRGDAPTPRHVAYLAVCRAVVRLRPVEREKAIAALRALPGANARPREDFRAMSADELRSIASSPLIEIGAHTVRHPVLASLGLDEQRDEIAESKAKLEDLLGKRISSFAYPFGSRSDYTAETVSAVRGAGYECACANFSGGIDSKTERYEVPRLLVRNWDAATFRSKLARWLAGDFQ